MKELIFNELSIQPFPINKTEAFQRVYSFIDTYKSASHFGFNRIRFDRSIHEIELTPGYTLNDFCNESAHRTKGVLLRGLARHPYIDDDSKEERLYILNNFSIYKDGIRHDVYGLAAAYLYSTLCIGYMSEPFWNNIKYELIICNELQVRTETVGCLSKPEHTEQSFFQEFFERNADVVLVKTDKAIEQKQIRLRDDHGKNVLEDFAKKIVKSKYVNGVINSLPFNPKFKQFVKAIHTDGKIEIVLTWTDCGYGMVIESTGRTRAETIKIAEILTNEYANS